MKLGIHAMAWTSHWSDESLPLIDRVADLGLDFIEIPLMDVDEVHPAPIRARLDDAGIDVVTSTVLSESTDITSDDADVREAGLEYLRWCVDVTSEMWPDGCLGVPRPGVSCTQAIVPGFRVTLRLGSRTFEYHTDLNDHVERATP